MRPTVRDGQVLMVLIALSLVLGWSINRIRGQPVSIPYVRTPAAAQSADLDLGRFSELRRDSGVVVLDARPEIFFEVGHIPGALSLPQEDFAAGFERLRPRLESAASIVVYCADADCEDARQLKANLLGKGLKDVAVYPDGWEGWTRAGLPPEKGAK